MVDSVNLKVLKVQLEFRQCQLVSEIALITRKSGGVEATKEEVESSVRNESNEERIRLLGIYETEWRRNENILHRIENGTYGICKKCDEPIAEVRLRSEVADTSICVLCAEKEPTARISGLQTRRSRKVFGHHDQKDHGTWIRAPREELGTKRTVNR